MTHALQIEGGGDLLALIERLEKATGPDRGLHGMIAVAAGVAVDVNPRNPQFAKFGDDDIFTRCPNYTESIDAALTLLPEGWCSLRFERTHDTWGCFLDGDDTNAVTPAIALCIAALKARHQFYNQPRT